MYKKLLFIIVLLAVPLNAKMRQVTKPKRCEAELARRSPAWIHDWYFYWPYHYYGYQHPYYWHDGFHMSFGC